MAITFKNFIGNEQVKAALTAAFLKDRLPQAIILQGENGVGKKTLAHIIANIAVCTSNDKPCGFCPACQRAIAGSHPDIRVEQGSGISGNISVDTVRSIIDDAQKKPEEADLNIYLLFIKNKLSEASQNKLLKVMEEPPGKALFIITINSADALLPTIRSRSVCFTLLPPTVEKSAKYYSELKSSSYEDSLQLARLHSGNIGSMLGGNDLYSQKAIDIINVFDNSDEDAFLASCYSMSKDRNEFAQVLEKLRAIIRDAVVYSVSSNDDISDIGIDKKQSIRIANRYRKTNLIKIVDICTEYISLSKRNLNMNLLVTSFCVKLREQILK